MKMKSIIIFLFFLGLSLSAQNITTTNKNVGNEALQTAVVLEATKGESSKELELPAEDLQWWRDAKFGMFIHWGLYSIIGKGEWYMFNKNMDVREYRKLKDQFTAEKFNAKDWAQCAKDAGMKYMVMTSRHHDGFSLWDSPSSYDNFTSINSAAKKDFVAEYIQACREAGLKVGLYYSPLDWRFPGYFFPDMYRENAEQLKAQTYSQVEELMKNYGKIDVLWYDGGGDDWLGLGGLQWTGKEGWGRRPKDQKYKGTPLFEPIKLNTMVRQYQPKVIMNERSGYEGDFTSREKEMGDFDNQRPWEKCGTISAGWGYMSVRTEPLSLKKILGNLSNIVCRDGNYLLNVGPRPDGQIEPSQVARLKEVGDWLKLYGECIYETKGGPILPTPNYGATSTSKAVYIHVWEWPADGKITIEGLKGIKSGKPLTADNILVSVKNGVVQLSCDKMNTDNPLTVIKFKL
jgi:alpha-L-fucosidase